MSFATNTQSQNGATPLQCLEVKGGNYRVSYALELPGLTGWLHSEPAEQSLQGGDIHYVSLCSMGNLARVALADVSGHGQSASVVATLLRRLIQEHIDTWDQSELMRQLNASLTSHLTHSQYASAILLAYYVPTSELVFTNAGHPPPLWYRAARKTWEWLESKGTLSHYIEGLPLGLIAGTDYLQLAVRLEPDDLLILYTDGITEARDPDGRSLDPEGLLNMVQSLSIDQPARMSEDFIARLHEFRGVPPHDDDYTFCILRNKGRKQAEH